MILNIMCWICTMGMLLAVEVLGVAVAVVTIQVGARLLAVEVLVYS